MHGNELATDDKILLVAVLKKLILNYPCMEYFISNIEQILCKLSYEIFLTFFIGFLLLLRRFLGNHFFKYHSKVVAPCTGMHTTKCKRISQKVF